MKAKCLVSIAIPTYNRPNNLRRILSYYNRYGQKYNIIVADSSSDENKSANKKIVSSFYNLNILYLSHYSSKICIWHKIVDSLNYTQREYSLLCGDDDFITPNGINQSVDFLEQNPDFTVAHGRYIRFWSRPGKGDKQQFFWKPAGHFPSIIFPDPGRRVSCHFSNYHPTTYGVHRSAFLKLILEETIRFTSDVHFCELLPSMLTLIYGKMKCLDVLYAAREATPNSVGITSTSLRDFIREGAYEEKYVEFRNCLSSHLHKESQLTFAEAQKVIDQAISIYLSAHAMRNEPLKNILIRRIKNILEHLGLPDWIYVGIKSAYRKLFLSKQRRMDDFRSFADTPFSKYYSEISNIYNIITSCPVQRNDRRSTKRLITEVLER